MKFVSADNLQYIWQKVKNLVSTKVDKIDGKGLSTNDYTDDEKTKLAGIESNAEVNVIETIAVNNVSIAPTSKRVNINVPTAISDLTDDSDFVNSDELSEAIGSLTGTSFEVVDQLPLISQAEDNVIYLVPNGESSATTNYYDEYIKVKVTEGTVTIYQWEKIGNTSVDLSNYYTKTEADNTFLIDTDLNDYYTKEEVDGKLLTLNNIYPIGSIYTTTNSNFSPSVTFGGVWLQIATLTGGELIAFGTAFNTSNNTTLMVKDTDYSFSNNTMIPNKQFDIENYIDGILTSNSGTFSISTKGIVGLVEAELFISGQGQSGCTGIWFGGNENSLPSGVSVWPRNDRNGLMTVTTNGYGGTSNKYFYKVDANSYTRFYVNPTFRAYGGDFGISRAGTKTYLMVKVYAQSETTYVWKRTS